MNPEETMAKYGEHLSDREREEIQDYSFVYYVGENAKNLLRRKNPGYEANGGYDDLQGYYHAVIGDHIAFRYEILGSLGSGACGQVVKAFDHKHREKVAIKLIRNVPLFKELAQQEISVGKKLSKVDAMNNFSVVHLLNHFAFRHHPCMVFELLGLNLFELMRSHEFQGLPEDIVREFAHEMLMSLTILRKNNIVHCDIKPQNIMLFNRRCNCTDVTLLAEDRKECALAAEFAAGAGVNEGETPPRNGLHKSSLSQGCLCATPELMIPAVHPDNVLSTLAELGCEHHLKLIDFGCSSKMGHCRYPYIQSRYYRAPEVILGCGYSCPIDMWSFACVVSELLAGKPLLRGENETDQLSLIIELFGMPPENMLRRAKRYGSYFYPDGRPKYCRVVENEKGEEELAPGRSPSGATRLPPGGRTLKESLQMRESQASDQVIDFLKRCFAMDPVERMTPTAALQHPWMRERLVPEMRRRTFTS